MSKEIQIGTLVVVVLKARNLIDKHSFYKQDVFAQASLNGKVQTALCSLISAPHASPEGTTKPTHVNLKGGQHPVWDVELRFPIVKVASDQTRKLEVACFAKEPRGNDLLGKGTVDLSETLKTGEFDDWVSLDIDGTVRGELFLEMTYFSSEPAPAITNPPLNSKLKLPSGQNLNKPLPSERLSKLPQEDGSQSIPVSSPSGSVAAQRPSRPTSHSPSKGKDPALPPLPEDRTGQNALPGILVPGGRTGAKLQGSSLGLGPPPPLLVPGNGNVPRPTSWSQDPTRRPSTSPPNLGPAGNPPPFAGVWIQNPYMSESARSTPIPSPIPPSISSAIPSASANYLSHTNDHEPLHASSSAQWEYYHAASSTGSLTFPMPMVAAPASQLDLREYYPYRSYGHHPTIHQPPSPSLDPHLWSRYKNPLPLPPGTDPKSSIDSPGAQKQDLRLPKSDRLQVLRSAEEEHTRKWEQEERDRELALQLDRELNI